jgi:hypothetical protein
MTGGDIKMMVIQLWWSIIEAEDMLWEALRRMEVAAKSAPKGEDADAHLWLPPLVEWGH